jgi:hypothetical protein
VSFCNTTSRTLSLAPGFGSAIFEKASLIPVILEKAPENVVLSHVLQNRWSVMHYAQNLNSKCISIYVTRSHIIGMIRHYRPWANLLAIHPLLPELLISTYGSDCINYVYYWLHRKRCQHDEVAIRGRFKSIEYGSGPAFGFISHLPACDSGSTR